VINKAFAPVEQMLNLSLCFQNVGLAFETIGRKGLIPSIKDVCDLLK
jgi:hypothetical protein